MLHPTQRPLAAASAALASAALLAVLALAGCTRAEPDDGAVPARQPKPVSGRVDTGAGVSFDFPDGWSQVSTEGRTYTRLYENEEQRLSLGINDFRNNETSIWTLGEQVKRRLGNNGTILESGPTTVDGNEAFRVVAQVKTDTGHGLIIGTVVMRPPDRAAAVYVFSNGDERPGNREQMESLLSTLQVS